MFNVLHANSEKEKIQLEAVRLSEVYDNLLLNWATGTGKTYAALRVINKWIMLHSRMPRVYIILKEIAHFQNWADEFKKHQRDKLLEETRFFCYASLHKFADTQCDILILDECQSLSEMRDDYLKSITCDKILSLSATVLPLVIRRIEEYKPQGFYRYNVSLEDAIQRGILPTPEIKVAYVELDDRNHTYNWRSKTRNPRRGLNYLTAKQYYAKLTAQVEYWEKRFKEKREKWAEAKYLRAGLARKEFMAKAKTEATKKLLKTLEERKYICFCGSIEQANELGGSSAITSKVEEEVRQETIDCFNNGNCTHIYAVKMLREGMNLNGIEAALIVQLDNQQGSFEQMTGRALRSIAPQVFILVLKGTKDEDYFDKATRGISSKFISEYAW